MVPNRVRKKTVFKSNAGNAAALFYLIIYCYLFVNFEHSLEIRITKFGCQTFKSIMEVSNFLKFCSLNFVICL